MRGESAVRDESAVRGESVPGSLLGPVAAVGEPALQVIGGRLAGSLLIPCWSCAGPLNRRSTGYFTRLPELGFQKNAEPTDRGAIDIRKSRAVNHL